MSASVPSWIRVLSGRWSMSHRFLKDVGHRMVATFRRLLHEMHRQRGLAHSGRAGDERDGAPLHTAVHQLIQPGDAARYWLRREVLVVCFGEQPRVHEDAPLGDPHGTATFLEARATVLAHRESPTVFGVLHVDDPVTEELQVVVR